MKYVFLIIGLICGIFWSQIYTEFGKFTNEYMFPQPVVAQKQTKTVSSPVKSVQTPKVDPVVDANQPDSKQVIMYATSWCGYCKSARDYFRKNRVSFIEYDIEKDERAKRMHDLLGGGGVPLILYNGKKMHGFSPSMFIALYR